jgi:hypothetical protein
MIVPIWRSWFLFRFKGERTAPESLMGTDSGFVLVGSDTRELLISLYIRHSRAGGNPTSFQVRCTKLVSRLRGNDYRMRMLTIKR